MYLRWCNKITALISTNRLEKTNRYQAIRFTLNKMAQTTNYPQLSQVIT